VSRSLSYSFLKIKIIPPKNFTTFFLHYYWIWFTLASIIFISCSATERYTTKEETIKTASEEKKISTHRETSRLAAEIRVMLGEVKQDQLLSVETSVYLSDSLSQLTLIEAGSKVFCSEIDGNLDLTVNGENFIGQKYYFSSANGNEEIININGKRYRGQIQISVFNNSIDLINIVRLEDYVKGVMAKEMPLGKNNENFEALKALSVCIRTYAIKKMMGNKIYFDLYDDTRDQVYGGVDAESQLSNKATDETKNLILKYAAQPALLYYHSTCGGYTESVENVFTQEPIPYLISIQDGNEPYCIISPRFRWEEIYDHEELIYRLKKYSLLDDTDYFLEDIFIKNRFESGRVAELEVVVLDDNDDEKVIVLKGNEIRNILRTANNKNILWSTMFDISVDKNYVRITGRGFGHGVGLCQWGAIALSRMGWDFREIIQHYYPGIDLGNYND